MAVFSLLFAGVAFGLQLHWATVALAVPVGVLGALSFAPFGVLLLASTIVVKQAVAGTTWIIAGISLVAGLYFPVSLLPAWLRWVSDAQPFTPAVDLLRHTLVNAPLRESWLVSVGKLAAYTVLLLPAAIWVLARALDFARRRGTLTEY
jgi:ABC-2 type transport system permease protein